MLVSPAEPPPFKHLGVSSSIPERYGVDFLMFSPSLGKVGVQRKTIADLLASLADDRLERELLQMQALDIAILIIEGRVEWTTDGFLLGTSSEFTRAQYQAILWSLQSRGLWISFTSSTTETIEYLSLFTRWMTKDRHTSLLRRSKGPARNVFGTRGSREWQIHVMQGFPGIGYDRAEAIIDLCGGLPLQWTVQLSDVKGIGKKTAATLEGLLES